MIIHEAGVNILVDEFGLRNVKALVSVVAGAGVGTASESLDGCSTAQCESLDVRANNLVADRFGI